MFFHRAARLHSTHSPSKPWKHANPQKIKPDTDEREALEPSEFVHENGCRSRRLFVVAATSCARRRLIRSVGRLAHLHLEITPMEDKQLDHLMTYTTFHVGVYVSLTATLIGLGLWGQYDTHPDLVAWLRYAVACLTIAGICGGVIGSNIPNFKEYATFNRTRIGFWSLRIFPAWVWIKLEHLAFWAGLLPIAVMFILKGPNFFK